MAASMIVTRGFNKIFTCFHRNYYAVCQLDSSLCNVSSCNVVEKRNRFRGKLIRQPLKVHVPGEEDAQVPHVKRVRKPLEKVPLKSEYDENLGNETSDSSDVPHHAKLGNEASDSSDVPHYAKLGNETSIFTNLMMVSKSRSFREKKKTILLEGRRLIKDALEAGVEPEAIFFSLDENIAGLPLKKHINLKVYKVMYKQMQIWSTLTTCPGIMGIFKMPVANDKKILEKNESRFPLTVICDNIREPGNLGAILRCVAAAGCTKVMLAKGCVDMWEPKVLRAAAGAHFRIPVTNNVDWSLMSNYVSDDADVYIADNKMTTEEYFEESNQTTITEAVNTGFYDLNKSSNKVTLYDDEEPRKFTRTPVNPTYMINALSYDKLRVDPSRETVLVIGGETHGLSAYCYQFALRRAGHKLTIPLLNEVESLNAAVATGILMYEILRQIKVGNKVE